MNYPGPGAYTDAMGFINTTVPDAVLSGGKVENDSWGMPLARSGAFAYTFKISTRTGDYAFRVFQAKRPGIQEHYKAISEEFAARPNAFFVDFKYLTQGISVEGSTYPAIRMRWADGDPLGVYIEEHVMDVQCLRVLQKNIDALALSLETAGIAHGDIQMNNVLVQGNGAVMLVDYDAMFVPGLTNTGYIEVGYPNFQHPKRSLIQPYDATLDRFSFALIHTGLEALIEKPSLWGTFKADPDALLFRGKDLADPANSPLFKKLKAQPLTGVLSQRLAALATAAYQGTPSVSDFLAGLNIPARSSSTSHTSSNIPWYQEPVVTHSSEAGAPRELDDDIWLIDARVVKDVFDHAGEDVMLVGRINKVDTTVGRLGQEDLVQFTLSMNARDSVFVNVWAEGMKNFAAAGITLDESWDSRWVTVEGTLSPILGSPTGQHVILTVTNTEDLQLTTYHDARRVLAGKETQQSTAPGTTPQDAVLNNDDLVANLSGSVSTTNKKSSGTSRLSSATGNVTTSGGSGTSKNSAFDNLDWAFIVMVILVVALATVVIFFSTQNSSNSGSVDQSTPTPVVTDTYVSSGDSPLASFSGKCLTGLNEIVECTDESAVLKVAGTALLQAGCGDRESIPRRYGYVCVAGMNESIAQPVTYETCIETTSGSITDGCVTGQQWSYSGCWEGGSGAALQQKQGGQWVTVKRDFAKKDQCMPKFPWTVEFDRKASGVGVKQYRIYFPPSGGFTETLENITVTVRET